LSRGRGRRANSRLDSCRYKMVKGWIHRAQKFRREAETMDEAEAWDKVEAWMRSILERKRYQDERGVIKMHAVGEEDCHEKVRS
jgi:hypothetical protein